MKLKEIQSLVIYRVIDDRLGEDPTTIRGDALREQLQELFNDPLWRDTLPQDIDEDETEYKIIMVTE